MSGLISRLKAGARRHLVCADLGDDDPSHSLQVVHVRGVHVGRGREALLLLQTHVVVVVGDDVDEAVAVLVDLGLADVLGLGGVYASGELLDEVELFAELVLGELALVHHAEHVEPHGAAALGHGGLPEEVDRPGQGDLPPPAPHEKEAEEEEEDGGHR